MALTAQQIVQALNQGQYPRLPQGVPAPLMQPRPLPTFSGGSVGSNATMPNTQGSPQLIQTGQAQLKAKKNAQQAGGGYITHVVKPGETLWGIAQQYTGNGDNWKNFQGFHSDPRSLQPGTVVHIPMSDTQQQHQQATTQGQNLMPSPVYGNTLA